MTRRFAAFAAAAALLTCLPLSAAHAAEPVGGCGNGWTLATASATANATFQYLSPENQALFGDEDGFATAILEVDKNGDQYVCYKVGKKPNPGWNQGFRVITVKDNSGSVKS